MSSELAHVNAVIQCPHQAPGQITSANTRVKVSGMFVALQSDPCLYTGCPFAIGPNPSPCLTTQWLVPAVRVTVMGQPVLLKNSVGLCQNPAQAPQGPPTIQTTQLRVKGT